MLKQQNIALGIYENKLILNFFDGSGYRRNKGENHFAENDQMWRGFIREEILSQ